MNKNYLKSDFNQLLRCGFCLFIIIVCFSFPYAVSAQDCYAIVIGGSDSSKNDVDLMYERLKKNELFKNKNIKRYEYNIDKGEKITKAQFELRVRESMEGATSNDVYIFYYSGHGNCDLKT